MSGIVGIYHRQGESVQPERLGLMVDSLAHRGSDGSKVWHEGNIGLGHLMLYTTPESLIEELPYSDHSIQATITADARIDNRDELIDLLGLEREKAGRITDSSLILKAYHKWGKNCTEKLIGDFAFVVWDNSEQELFCVRDHFGIKPFYYYAKDDIFIFASEIKAILTLPEVPRKLNEAKVADYMVGDFDNLCRTFYQQINRLPAGHCLSVTAKGLEQSCYWSLDISKEVTLESDTAYAKEFNRLFSEAVRCRLRSALPIGSELSGGLDSSTVSCVAKNLLQNADEPELLQTFSAVFARVEECDESEYINKVLAQGGFEPHYMQGDIRTPLTNIDDIFWYEDEAFFAPGFAAMTWGLCTLAKDRGARILLNGNDGDSTVSHGFGYLHDLAKAGCWLALYREIEGVAKIYDESAWRGFWNYFSAYTIKRQKCFKLLLKVSRKVWNLIKPKKQKLQQSKFVDRFNLEFAERVSISDRYQSWLKTENNAKTSSKAHHYRLLTQGMHSLGLEIADKAAAAHCLEMRYPFWDKRLVEFCLSLPAEQKLARGWTRIVMRRAMEGILPPEIQWRTSKMDFVPNFTQGLLEAEKQRLEQFLAHDSQTLAQYIDLETLRQKYDEGEDWQFIWRSVSLGLWLNFANFDNSQVFAAAGGIQQSN